jgi:5-methylcytosine-specific restriction enzyme B
MSTWIEAIGKAQQAGARILLDHPEGLRARELWPLIVEALPGIEEETASVVTGSTTPFKNFQWCSVDLVKAGWLTKTGGRWFVTPVGRMALQRWPDPTEFYRAANSFYREWQQHRARFDLAKRLVEAVPEGSWVAAADLAAAADLEPDRLLFWLQGERPEGWYRVLDEDGGVPDDVHADDETRQQWDDLLGEDGITTLFGRVPAERRVLSPDLEQLALDERGDAEAVQRVLGAWLVRGSNVQGYNLVADWLADGYCSLPASKLREVPAGASREAVRKAVDADYEHATYNERLKRATEFYMFLSRMYEGDLVLTTDGSDVYLGVLRGEATFVSSVGGRANLQRRVDWHNVGNPYDFADDLPDEMAAKLATQHDVLDLAEFVPELNKLLGRQDAGTPPITVVRELFLPDATEELADRLLVPRGWLQECVELLRDRPQLIFFGPPGTGKTYLAQQNGTRRGKSAPWTATITRADTARRSCARWPLRPRCGSPNPNRTSTGSTSACGPTESASTEAPGVCRSAFR